MFLTSPHDKDTFCYTYIGLQNMSYRTYYMNFNPAIELGTDNRPFMCPNEQILGVLAVNPRIWFKTKKIKVRISPNTETNQPPQTTPHPSPPKYLQI